MNTFHVQHMWQTFRLTEPIHVLNCTVQPVNIQIKVFSSTDSRRGKGFHREQALYQTVRKSKLLQMQPLDEATDIVWQGYVPVKFEQRVNI